MQMSWLTHGQAPHLPSCVSQYKAWGWEALVEKQALPKALLSPVHPQLSLLSGVQVVSGSR